MKAAGLWLTVFLLTVVSLPADDTQAAQQYVLWIRQAIDDNRWGEALAAAERAADFSGSSSDISYLLAFIRSHERKNRQSVIEALELAIETNRWFLYNEGQALLLMAEQLIPMRAYSDALFLLDQLVFDQLAWAPAPPPSENAGIASDAAMLRLLAVKGMISNFSSAQTTAPHAFDAQFRSRVLETIDRYPRDPRPFRVFFDYINNKKLKPSVITEGDLNLLELVLKRLPFLIEADPELAWIAAPYIRDKEEAKRLAASYRSGGIPNVRIRDFKPSPGSIVIALQFGLLGDNEAVEEFFSGSRGFNYPLPAGVAPDGNPVLERNVLTDVYASLGSEEGRDLFTKKLLSFSGTILDDEDGDGYFDSRAVCREGAVREIDFDFNGDNESNFRIFFTADGGPVNSEYFTIGDRSRAFIEWERYPSVSRVKMTEEIFSFRPAEFQFAPVAFVELGGSNSHSGLAYPVPLHHNMDLSRRSLVSFCANIQRPSAEFSGAVEQIFFREGIPLQAVITLNGKQVSVMEFERGRPSVQRLDIDLDGRMETVRRFNYAGSAVSSESDWTGEGIYKTGEIHLPDGSVVYSWDIDGRGMMNYTEIRSENE